MAQGPEQWGLAGSGHDRVLAGDGVDHRAHGQYPGDYRYGQQYVDVIDGSQHRVWASNEHLGNVAEQFEPAGPDHTPEHHTQTQLRDDDSRQAPDNGPRPEHIAADGRYKLSGHGTYSELDGHFVVPEGTIIRVFAEHGAKISTELGNLIEIGGDFSHVYSRTYHAGEHIPNYTLLPPDDLDIKGSPYTVDKAARLSELLHSDMGYVDFAACLGRWVDKVYDVDRIYDDVTMHTIERYEIPEIYDDDW